MCFAPREPEQGSPSRSFTTITWFLVCMYVCMHVFKRCLGFPRLGIRRIRGLQRSLKGRHSAIIHFAFGLFLLLSPMISEVCMGLLSFFAACWDMVLPLTHGTHGTFSYANISKHYEDDNGHHLGERKLPYA